MTDAARLRELFEMACQARQRAHSPYSEFAVGAVLETTDGDVFTGCNVENGAYGLCICAEQVAITKAVSEGHRDFQRIVVVANPLASPCGACRQIISEFFSDAGMIHSIDADDFNNQLSWSMTELLPDRFELGK